MKISLSLLFVLVLLLADRSNVIATEVERNPPVIEGGVITDMVTADGQVYVFDRGHIHLKSGEERKVDGSCVTENVSFFTQKRTCSWKKLVKATDTGLVVLPGGTTMVEETRGLKVWGVIFCLISLLVLIPTKEFSIAALSALGVIYAVGTAVNLLWGSWLWFILLGLNFIAVIFVGNKIDDDEECHYGWRLPVIVSSLVVLIFA